LHFSACTSFVFVVTVVAVTVASNAIANSNDFDITQPKKR